MRPWPDSRFADFECHVETIDGQRLCEYHDNAPESSSSKRRTVYLECPPDLDKSLRVVYSTSTAHRTDFAVDIDIDGKDIGYSRGYRTGWRGQDAFENVLYLDDEERGMALCDLRLHPPISREHEPGIGEMLVILQEGNSTMVPPYAPSMADTTKMPSDVASGSVRPAPKEYCTGFFEQSRDHTSRFVFAFKYGTRQALLERRIIEPPDADGELDASGESDRDYIRSSPVLVKATDRQARRTARLSEIESLKARLAVLIREEQDDMDGHMPKDNGNTAGPSFNGHFNGNGIEVEHPNGHPIPPIDRRTPDTTLSRDQHLDQDHHHEQTGGKNAEQDLRAGSQEAEVEDIVAEPAMPELAGPAKGKKKQRRDGEEDAGGTPTRKGPKRRKRR